MLKSMYIPEGTRSVLQRLSDMQAVILYVGMCRRSCAYTNKLVFVCNRCAPETWGATLQVTSSPGLSLLTWETRHFIWASVSCQGARTLYLPLIKLGVHTFHQSHKELAEKFQTLPQADVTNCLFTYKLLKMDHNACDCGQQQKKMLKVQSHKTQPCTFWSVMRSLLLMDVMAEYQPAVKNSYLFKF